MKHITTISITICYWFFVLIPIESRTYIFNYDNFDEIFPQGTEYGLNLHKYEEIDAKFSTKYVGPNIGGAFQMNTPRIWHQVCSTTKVFAGYEANITASFYCDGGSVLAFRSPTCGWDYSMNMCTGDHGYNTWTYNRTMALKTCPEITKTFDFQICAMSTTGLSNDNILGLDQIKIETTENSGTTITAPPATTSTVTTPHMTTTTSVTTSTVTTPRVTTTPTTSATTTSTVTMPPMTTTTPPITTPPATTTPPTTIAPKTSAPKSFQMEMFFLLKSSSDSTWVLIVIVFLVLLMFKLKRRPSNILRVNNYIDVPQPRPYNQYQEKGNYTDVPQQRPYNQYQEKNYTDVPQQRPYNQYQEKNYTDVPQPRTYNQYPEMIDAPQYQEKNYTDVPQPRTYNQY